ncbi:hypothetical protein PFISCL1PPCAC_854, partial [Pristionchus fissidentatus]
YVFVVLLFLEAGPVSTDTDCGTKYRCFQPKDCAVGNILEQVTTELPDCYVTFKFHPYSEFWYRVIMETIEGVNKIELIKYNALKNTENPIFECGRVGNTTSVSYEGNKEIPKIINVSSPFERLKCEFDVRLKSGKVINLDDSDDYVQSIVSADNHKNKTDVNKILVKYFCLPTALMVPRDNFEQNKYYEKVSYNFGDVFCNQPNIFKTIEFREENSESYVQ